MRTKHDTPYYKKVYKRDTKNLKILIGHGGKTPKYAKKGGPFKLDPPKRRPVGKLSAPPMVLDEDISPELKSAFMNIKDAKVRFRTKKDIPKEEGSIIDAFKKGVFYNASIKGDQIETETNWTDQILSKQEFLSRLGKEGEICNVLDCDATTVTVKGQKPQTLRQMMKAGTETAKGDQTTKKSEQPKTKTQKDREEQSKVGGDVANRVAKDGNIQSALETGFFERYETDPYHPKAKEFSKRFYKIVDKSLKMIPDPDERQVAALTAVIFGTLGMGSVSAIAETSDLIPKEFFGEASKIVRGLIGKMGPEFVALGKKAEEIVKGTAKRVKKALGGGVLSLPNGQGKKVIFIGNSQLGYGGHKVFGDFFKSKGYKDAGYGNLTGTGGSRKGFPSYYSSGVGRRKLLKKIEKEGGAENVGAFCLFLGSYTKNPSAWSIATKELIETLKEEVPGCYILWVGPPPIQPGESKGDAARKLKLAQWDLKRRLNSKAMEVVANSFSDVYYINVYDYVNTSYVKRADNLYKDWIHMGRSGWKTVLQAALAGKKEKEEEEATEESDPKTGEVANKAKGISSRKRRYASLIEKKFAAEGFSENAIAAVITNSIAESDLNPYAIGDGGNSIGLFQLHRGSKSKPFLTKSGLDPDVAFETREKFRKLCKDNGVRINSRASVNLAKKGILADFVKERLKAGDFRFNPEKNIDGILRDFAIPKFKKSDKKNKPASELAYDFAAMVVRCRECKGSEGKARKQRVTKIFPEMN